MSLGIGAALLIAETMKDNPALMSLNTSGIYKRLIQLIEHFDINNPIKTTHMRCLKVYMKYKDNIL